MNHDDTDRCERGEQTNGRVLLHPSLFRSDLTHDGMERGRGPLRTNPAGEALRRSRRRDAVLWFLGNEELFNGCIAEIRLAAPAVWLQTRIEGLPEAPSACFHLADGTTVRVALTESSTARWPVGGVDRSLCSLVLDPPGEAGAEISLRDRQARGEQAHCEQAPAERSAISRRHAEPSQAHSQTMATKPK